MKEKFINSNNFHKVYNLVLFTSKNLHTEKCTAFIFLVVTALLGYAVHPWFFKQIPNVPAVKNKTSIHFYSVHKFTYTYFLYEHLFFVISWSVLSLEENSFSWTKNLLASTKIRMADPLICAIFAVFVTAFSAYQAGAWARHTMEGGKWRVL